MRRLRPHGAAHHLENRTEHDVIVLEVGDRVAGNEGVYPEDDVKAAMDGDGKWRFEHNDGTPY